MIDPDSGLCLGCGRTLEEIGRWSGMSEEEKRQIWEELPRRQKDLTGNS
ncbi:MAG: DUF1289 domain-containing protein [Leptospira sp.]|jgi:hypothetical protein|nr:DUF1289 domain-containing protein [Leptospira sp.]